VCSRLKGDRRDRAARRKEREAPLPFAQHSRRPDERIHGAVQVMKQCSEAERHPACRTFTRSV